MDIEKTKADLLALKNGEYLYFNMFQDGGAMAIKVHHDWLVLFEIPIYGGDAVMDDIYHIARVDQIIENALRWS